MRRPRFPRTDAAQIMLLIAGILLVLGCAASTQYRDGSLGSRLFYTRCRSCHAPVDPAAKTVAFWEQYLDKYAERARLNPAERDSVMAFVTRIAAQKEDPAAR